MAALAFMTVLSDSDLGRVMAVRHRMLMVAKSGADYGLAQAPALQRLTYRNVCMVGSALPSCFKREGTTVEAETTFLTAPVVRCHKTASSLLAKRFGILLRICTKVV